MSTILKPVRLTAMPSTTEPDTFYMIAHGPGELKIAITNSNNTLVYETIVASEVSNLVVDKLGEPGGVYEVLNLLQSKSHSHPHQEIIDNITTITVDGNDYLQYNGIALRPIITQEDW